MYNWTFLGAISYMFLFQASTWFTELITAGKYPEYKEYQNRVSKFMPSLYTDLPGDFSDQRGPTKLIEEKVEDRSEKNGEKITQKKVEKNVGKRSGGKKQTANMA